MMPSCSVVPNSAQAGQQVTLSWSLGHDAKMYYFYSDGRTGGPVEVGPSGSTVFVADAQDRATWLLYTFEDIVTAEVAFCWLVITP